ncbi:MAG: hypothetical protein C4297_09595 [Gemmataceae bacterium]
MVKTLTGLATLLGTVWLACIWAQDKPKYTIKEVMEQAHKGGLLKQVLSGKAAKEDRDNLLEYYRALAANKPPRGDLKSWKQKTEALVNAAEALTMDAADKKALAALKKASNCMACHNVHRGE